MSRHMCTLASFSELSPMPITSRSFHNLHEIFDKLYYMLELRTDLLSNTKHCRELLKIVTHNAAILVNDLKQYLNWLKITQSFYLVHTSDTFVC